MTIGGPFLEKSVPSLRPRFHPQVAAAMVLAPESRSCRPSRTGDSSGRSAAGGASRILQEHAGALAPGSPPGNPRGVTTQTRVVIGYDGSEIARAAMRAAAGLFPGQAVVVATVWEAGLAFAPMGSP